MDLGGVFLDLSGLLSLTAEKTNIFPAWSKYNIQPRHVKKGNRFRTASVSTNSLMIFATEWTVSSETIASVTLYTT